MKLHATKSDVTVAALDAVSRRRALTEGESLRLERAINSQMECAAKRAMRAPIAGITEGLCA